MAKKEYLVLKSFLHGDKMFYKNDDASYFNADTLKILLGKNLVGLRWRPDVIPLVEKPKTRKKKK